jgi:hypothetical protein
MRRLKSLLCIVGIFLGGMGLVISFAVIAILWMISVQFDRGVVKVFSKLDHSLVVVRQRLDQSRECLAAAKITVQDVETALRGWTRQEAAQRIESRTEAAEKTERLASALRQVDNWLEMSESSVEVLNDVLSIAQSTSIPAERTRLEPLLEELASLRTVCLEATELADRVHERVAEASDDNSTEERVGQVVQLVLRAVATLSSIDSRLEKCAETLSETRGQLQELKSQTHRWILIATVVVTLLLGWMAAGQGALCRLAWHGWRQT